jgi:hypothetical protein
MGEGRGRWRFVRGLPFRFFGGKFRPAIRDECRGLVVLRVCVTGAGLASCPAMGGAMVDTDAEESGSTQVEGVGEPVREVVGESVGQKKTPAVQRKTPTSLLEMTEEAVVDEFGSIIETIAVNIRGFKHLPSAKLLLELWDLAKRRGGVQPAEMQSFADLLIKSLEVESQPAIEVPGK